METVVMDEIPASEEPVQITGQILLRDEPTRVLEPEIQENHVLHQEPVVTQFDITKLSYELQQGYRIYVELLSDSNRNVTWPFLEPVDADSLGLLDYYERIKEPMCFATSEYKLPSSLFSQDVFSFILLKATQARPAHEVTSNVC
jgi:hypothetical protein